MSLLDDARKRINAIDEEMAKLFEQRMQAVEDVIRYKQAHQMKVLDTSREQYVIEHNTAFIQREEYRDSYIEFISEMMAISRKYQRSIINRDLIGYSGTEGAFSHIAAERVFLDHRKKSYASFEDVFHAVTEREVAYGVIPFENSYTGEVGEVLDLLMRYDVYINDISVSYTHLDVYKRQGIGGVTGDKDFILCGMNIHTEFAQLLFHCFNAVAFLDSQSASIEDVGISRGIHSKDS